MSPFQQALFASTNGFLGGVAFAPNGDVWSDQCAFSGSPLLRFARGSQYQQDGASLASESSVASDAGCGLTNNPDGFVYSNTSSGVEQIDAYTGAAVQTLGQPGNALGIASDPQTGRVVYVGGDCRFTPTCTIYSLDQTTGSTTVLAQLPGSEASFVDGIAFDPSGQYLFVSTRAPSFALTVLSRSGTVVQQVPMNDEPDGIAFHQSSPQFVITNDTDGNISRFTFASEDYTQTPTVDTFASGGYRGDLLAVGSDDCAYLTQDGTNFPDGASTSADSIVRICPGFAPSSGTPSPSANYVALGDSYSSGEGNPPFYPGTDGPNDYCHRSTSAYSQQLADLYSGSIYKFYACSGAVTADVTTATHDTEQPQLSEPGVDATANLVTMTIGGNDAGFASVISHCIEQYLEAQVANSGVGGAISDWLGLGPDPSCADSKHFTDSVETKIDDVFGPVKSTYKALLSRVSPTDTSVVVADYPHLFPDSSAEQNCIELSSFLTNADQSFFNQSADLLDEVLQTAAGQAGVNFVDVRPLFTGHGVCGNGGAWINGVTVASGSGGCTWSAFGRCIIPGGPPIIGSFHPNADGHAVGYAESIEDYISSATDLTPEGFPVDPTPLPDPPASTTAPSDNVQDLTVEPVTPETPSCEGTYQPGEQLSIFGSGFVPGESVSVYATSPGLGPAAQSLLTTIDADSTGSVSTVVRIPLQAQGFIEQGAKAGVGFFDAIGAGADGSHLDDVAMFGMNPAGGPCGTVEPYPFSGFDPPIDNFPQINDENAGRTLPVKFTVPGSDAGLSEILAPGYPQSAPVSCTSPASLASGDATSPTPADTGAPSDSYVYNWQTDSSWQGCRELIVKLVDGTYHEAVFGFG